MAGRPRKNEQNKTKGRKGTGTITKCVLKNDKEERRSTQLCKICGNCEKKDTCPRTKKTACKECKKCTNKDCPIYYISVKYKAFSPQINNGKRAYLGSFNTQEEAQAQIDKYKNGGIVEKSESTLFEILEKKNDVRLGANKITDNTYDRNEALRNKMRKYGIADKPIQKITTQEIQGYLNSLKDDCSQSEIDKHTSEINSGFSYALKYKLVNENPCKNLEPVESSLPVKIARPFELDEQKLLLDYIEETPRLTDIRSRMDDITFKNIIKLAFYSGQRIGEILALQTGYDKKHYTSDIDFEKEYFIISKTITRKKGKFILGDSTKNSKKRRRRGLPVSRNIDFNIAPPNVIENIFKEQIEHSKNNTNNTHHFLFCNYDGTFINHSQVTTTFKNICRKLHIQEDNPNGCHIHQARHSFVTRCLEAGLKVETIAELIGDNVEQVQKTYAHILKRFKDDELNKLHQYYENNN